MFVTDQSSFIFFNEVVGIMADRSKKDWMQIGNGKYDSSEDTDYFEIRIDEID